MSQLLLIRMLLLPLLFLLFLRPIASSYVLPSEKAVPAPYAPFLSNFEIEDSCQYVLCGPNHLSEFQEEGRIRPSSCAGQCDGLSQRLVTSRFKKEFLWGKCVEMCKERNPRILEDISLGGSMNGGRNGRHHHSGSSPDHENNNVTSSMQMERAYRERFNCMEDCFSSYERVRPHHKIARACIHAACSPSARAPSESSSLECFDRCAHHVSTRVPQSDWPTWSELLSTATCPPKANSLVLDKLECTDLKLWERMSKGASVSPDVLLLCLNGLCSYDMKCAKSCLGHVSSDIDPNDLPIWKPCTYSPLCANISDYKSRVACSDACLEKHKVDQQRMYERKRLEAESERRSKEEEARALSAGNHGASSSTSNPSSFSLHKGINFLLMALCSLRIS